MDATVLTEICFETKFSRISVVESILKTECSEVKGIKLTNLSLAQKQVNYIYV